MRIKNLPSIESMDGSQDALVIEQTDGGEDKSRKVSPAQIKQYVLGNSIDDIYSVMGQNGAKNLIPYPYPNESGFSYQGMTTTYDADGVFTINKVAGTATAYYRVATLNFLKPNTKYKLVFEVANATSISAFVQKPTSGDYVAINNKSSGIFEAEFETTAEEQTSNRSIGLWCSASDTETNATVKVMMMLASDTDETYQPYAKTNKELTKQISRLTTPTLIWEGSATDVGTTYNMTGNYTDFKYLLVSAKTNVEVKNILIPTSSISAANIYSDVLSAGTWNATDKAFAYNSSYGIKFTAANAFQLASLSYNNANWILRPRAIYGIG